MRLGGAYFPERSECLWGRCMSDANCRVENRHIEHVREHDPGHARVRSNFDRAAATYQHHNELQRRVAKHVLARCRVHRARRCDNWPVLLDLGCGPGVNTTALSAVCHRYLGVDISNAMLRQAQKQPSRGADLHWVQSDMDSLALASDTVDVVFSSLALQWSANPAEMMEHLAQVLAPGGRMFIATLVEGTLEPLRSLRFNIDGIRQGNLQPSVTHWLDIINSLEGLASLELDVRSYTIYEQNLLHLLKGIQGVGAGTYIGPTAHHLSVPTFRSLAAAYEPHRTRLGLPLHYEVAFMTLVKAP